MKTCLHSLLCAASLSLPFCSALAIPNGSDNAGNYFTLNDYRGVNGGSGFADSFSSTTANGATAGTFWGLLPPAS